MEHRPILPPKFSRGMGTGEGAFFKRRPSPAEPLTVRSPGAYSISMLTRLYQ